LKKLKTILRFTKTKRKNIQRKVNRILRHPLPLFWVIFLTFLFLFRFVTTRPVYKIGDTVRITSRVLTEPIISYGKQKFKVQNLSIKLPQFPQIGYGDKVVVEGVVGEKKVLENPKLIKKVSGNNILFSFRQKIISFYQDTLPEPHSSLVAGIIMGSKGNIPYQFWSDLKTTGTAHMVVASGTNVTFVAGFILSVFLLFLSRRWAIPLCLGGIGIYVILSGLDAPIVRAAIMAVVALIAQELGRVQTAVRSLIYSAYIMIFINPDWVGDLGFVLSFAATTSLIIFQKPIEGLIRKIPSFIRADLSTTLAAQIGVVPILFFAFGQFNPLSPLINLLVLWTVPPIMILGALGGVVGLVFPILGRFILVLVYPMTWWFNTVINLFS